MTMYNKKKNRFIDSFTEFDIGSMNKQNSDKN